MVRGCNLDTDAGAMLSQKPARLLLICLLLLAGGDQVQVGIVHNHMVYEPKHPLAFSAAWVGPIVKVINQAWVSGVDCMNNAAD